MVLSGLLTTIIPLLTKGAESFISSKKEKAEREFELEKIKLENSIMANKDIAIANAEVRKIEAEVSKAEAETEKERIKANGFVHPMRGDDRFPDSLIPLWLFYYFDYKNYGAVKNLKPTVRGLLTNLGVIQSSIKNAYYNSPPGPGMSKKEKEIENMYIEEFGDVDVFRGRGDTMLPQTEAKLLIKATNRAGFHYNNGSIQ